MENLDLNDIALDEVDTEELDSLDLNNYGVINEIINEPHLKMHTSDVKNMLKVAKSIISVSARDTLSKSICLKRVEDKVVAYVTDFDNYLEYTLDLLNADNILEDCVVFPVDTMLKLIKAVPSSTIIFKDEEGYKLKLIGGSLPLETHDLTDDKFKLQCETELSKVPTMQSTDLANILKSYYNLVNSAISPVERRIVFSENMAIGVYMFSAIYSEGQFPTMDLKIKDINILKQLITDDEELMFYDTVNTKVSRKLIVGEKFKLAFIVSDDCKVPELILNGINKTDFASGIYIDLVQLFKMIELSSDLNNSTGKVEFNINEDNSLKLVLKTQKSKDSEFTLKGNIEGIVKPIRNNIEVQSKLLKVLLKAFAGNTSVKVLVTSDALTVTSHNFKSVLFISDLL